MTKFLAVFIVIALLVYDIVVKLAVFLTATFCVIVFGTAILGMLDDFIDVLRKRGKKALATRAA